MSDTVGIACLIPAALYLGNNRKQDNGKSADCCRLGDDYGKSERSRHYSQCHNRYHDPYRPDISDDLSCRKCCGAHNRKPQIRDQFHEYFVDFIITAKQQNEHANGYKRP